MLSNPDDAGNPYTLDQDLLALRDRLELNADAGDHRFDWLLKHVKQRISEAARQACLENDDKR